MSSLTDRAGSSLLYRPVSSLSDPTLMSSLMDRAVLSLLDRAAWRRAHSLTFLLQALHWLKIQYSEAAALHRVDCKSFPSRGL
jgi:hypothetical protein